MVTHRWYAVPCCVRCRTDALLSREHAARCATRREAGLKEKMFNKSWIAVLGCLVNSLVAAQTAPTAGGQIQQIPPAPVSPIVPPQLEVRREPSSSVMRRDVTTFVAKRLVFVGAQVYSSDELLQMTGFTPEQPMNLQTLYGMADQITQRYRRDGYLVAQAYIPTQDVSEGEVKIIILEGSYGQVVLRNTAPMDDAVLADVLLGLSRGAPILQQPLENRLLLLSDVPGVQVQSRLLPGATLGTSDLWVDVAPTAPVSGSIDFDNAGNRYTGTYRLGGTLNVNNPTGAGDQISLRALTSGVGLNYFRGAYLRPVAGWRMGVAYSDLRYALGQEFESLQAHGSARMVSLWGTYAMVRSRAYNQYVSLGLDHKLLSDHQDSVGSNTKKSVDVWTATLHGDQRDVWGGGGLTRYSVGASLGALDIRTPEALSTDDTTARTQGAFKKLSFSLTRLQALTSTLSLVASASGQLASKNLNTSEKMELGGMYGVRAYPEGEAYADQGYLLSLELRKRARTAPTPSSVLHWIGFIDAGQVNLNHQPWSDGRNQRQLSGIGVGVNWDKANDYLVKAFYAVKLGSETAQSAPDRSGRFWIQTVKFF